MLINEYTQEAVTQASINHLDGTAATFDHGVNELLVVKSTEELKESIFQIATSPLVRPLGLQEVLGRVNRDFNWLQEMATQPSLALLAKGKYGVGYALCLLLEKTDRLTHENPDTPSFRRLLPSLYNGSTVSFKERMSQHRADLSKSLAWFRASHMRPLHFHLEAAKWRAEIAQARGHVSLTPYYLSTFAFPSSINISIDAVNPFEYPLTCLTVIFEGFDQHILCTRDIDAIHDRRDTGYIGDNSASIKFGERTCQTLYTKFGMPEAPCRGKNMAFPPRQGPHYSTTWTTKEMELFRDVARYHMRKLGKIRLTTKDLSVIQLKLIYRGKFKRLREINTAWKKFKKVLEVSGSWGSLLLSYFVELQRFIKAFMIREGRLEPKSSIR